MDVISFLFYLFLLVIIAGFSVATILAFYSFKQDLVERENREGDNFNIGDRILWSRHKDYYGRVDEVLEGVIVAKHFKDNFCICDFGEGAIGNVNRQRVSYKEIYKLEEDNSAVKLGEEENKD